MGSRPGSEPKPWGSLEAQAKGTKPALGGPRETQARGARSEPALDGLWNAEAGGGGRVSQLLRFPGGHRCRGGSQLSGVPGAHRPGPAAGHAPEVHSPPRQQIPPPEVRAGTPKHSLPPELGSCGGPAREQLQAKESCRVEEGQVQCRRGGGAGAQRVALTWVPASQAQAKAPVSSRNPRCESQ